MRALAILLAGQAMAVMSVLGMAGFAGIYLHRAPGGSADALLAQHHTTTPTRRRPMACIRTEIDLTTDADTAWDAVRDFGARHERLAPGFATDARLEGDDRVVTFFTGTVLRERLIALDDERRRLAWSIVDGPYTHHNGSVEVFEAPSGGCRLVWTTDLLPDEAAERTRGFVEQGTAIIKQTLDGQPAAAG